MNIKEQIKQIRLSRDKSEFSQIFGTNKVTFNALLEVVKNLEEYPYKEYGSWILMHLVRSNPSQYQYIYPDLVDILFRTKNETVLRNVTNTIVQLDLTEYKESEFMDLLIAFIQNPKHKVALHVYSLDVLTKFCVKYPDVTPEIESIVEHHSDGKSVAFNVAIRRFKNSI